MNHPGDPVGTAAAIRRCRLILLLLLPLALCGCRIAMVGDSITEGVCASDPCTGWVELVAAELTDAEVVNAGCGATTTASWIQRPPEPPVGFQCVESYFVDAAGNFAADALGRLWEPFAPYDATFVLLGNNDARFTGFLTDPKPIEPSVYRANLERLIDELLVESSAVVLMIPTARASTTHPATAQRLEAYADEIVRACQRRAEVRCGPDLREVIDPALHYEPDDGIHPNQAGHRAIADAVVAWIAAQPETPASDADVPDLVPTLPEPVGAT